MMDRKPIVHGVNELSDAIACDAGDILVDDNGVPALAARTSGGVKPVFGVADVRFAAGSPGFVGSATPDLNPTVSFQWTLLYFGDTAKPAAEVEFEISWNVATGEAATPALTRGTFATAPGPLETGSVRIITDSLGRVQGTLACAAGLARTVAGFVGAALVSPGPSPLRVAVAAISFGA